MISTDDIKLVNERMDVVEVVSNFIKLKKKGANYTGNCPFHNEKTASFTVSSAKQIYKCFGCGKSGNAITFVMEHERYSYPDAVKWIAAKYNIEIEETFKSDEERIKANESESLYIINKFAGEYFKTNLKANQPAIDYITGRGITLESISKFDLGYCGDNYDDLAKEITEKKYSVEVATAAGLIKEKNGRLYDSYHTRIIFPVHNLSGKIVAFGGRILTSDERRPKYINSPENSIYHKGSSIYGLYQARAEITKQDEAILVEGYTDVISFHQAEICNTIASSGTSLTEAQIRIIRRFTKNIIILYDGDQAGHKAMIRAMELAVNEGMSIRIVILPQGEDPDSIVRNKGKEYTTNFIQENKKDIVDFFTNTQDISTPDKKDLVLKDLCKIIIKIGEDNHFRRSHYIDKTCAMFGITRKVLSKYIDSVAAAEKFNVQSQPSIIQEEAKVEPMIFKREKELTKLLLKHGDKQYKKGQLVCQYILETVQLEKDEYYIPNPITVSIHNQYKNSLENDGELPDINIFISSNNTDVSSFASSVAIEDDLISLNWKESLEATTEDYKQQVNMAIGLYYISHCKMNLWMLHNKVDKSSPEWTPEIINKTDQEIRKMIRDKAAELGLTNFKF